MKGRHVYLILFGSYALAMQAFKALGMIEVYSTATALSVLIAWSVMGVIFLFDIADFGESRKRAQLTERIVRRTLGKVGEK